MQPFDLLVIGSGPAGQKAALQAAKVGRRVAVIENGGRVGGSCVHLGTLPSKSFRESVYRWSMGSGGTLSVDAGGPGKRKVDLPDMMRLLKRRNRVVDLESKVIAEQFKRNHVEVLLGDAQFVNPHEVEVVSKDESGSSTVQRVKFHHALIATGARPVPPNYATIDGVDILDSNTVLNQTVIPRSMVVLGAGVIGCEYASMFLTAGTKVHLVDKRHEVLASVDREIVGQLLSLFLSQGLELHLETEAIELMRSPQQKSASGAPLVGVKLSNGKELWVEKVLIAQGRQGNVEKLGLEQAGIVASDRGLITVDANFRTSVPHIYAAGDVIGSPALASTSMEQGRMASRHMFGVESEGCDTSLYPYGIYTIPEIATIGETEESLRKQGVPFVVGREYYRELARGQIVGDHWGLLKMLVHRHTLKILGIHIMGDSAADLIHIGQAVMCLGGDVNYFVRSVFNYPTLAEAYKAAALHALNHLNAPDPHAE